MAIHCLLFLERCPESMDLRHPYKFPNRYTFRKRKEPLVKINHQANRINGNADGEPRNYRYYLICPEVVLSNFLPNLDSYATGDEMRIEGVDMVTHVDDDIVATSGSCGDRNCM